MRTAPSAEQKPLRHLHATNACAIRANWGYVRPEKQMVWVRRRGAATVAKPLNSTRHTWTTLEYRPSPRTAKDGPGRLAHSYGSEVRARRVPDKTEAYHGHSRARPRLSRPGLTHVSQIGKET